MYSFFDILICLGITFIICLLFFTYKQRRFLLSLPAKAKNGGVFFVYCPIKWELIPISDLKARVEPRNMIQQTLVVDCVCGNTHYKHLPLYYQDSVREQQRKELRDTNFVPRALRGE